jgi:hypothetical protein
VRRRKREQRQAGELELTDREQAKAALRRALDGRNNAAMVAAAKALIDFDTSPIESGVTVDDARAQLIARLDEIEHARRTAGQVCPTCDRPLPPDEASRREGGAGDGGGGRVSLPRGPEPKQNSGEPPPASVAGRPGGENPRRDYGGTWLWGDGDAA